MKIKDDIPVIDKPSLPAITEPNTPAIRKPIDESGIYVYRLEGIPPAA